MCTNAAMRLYRNPSARERRKTRNTRRRNRKRYWRLPPRRKSTWKRWTRQPRLLPITPSCRSAYLTRNQVGCNPQMPEMSARKPPAAFVSRNYHFKLRKIYWRGNATCTKREIRLYKSELWLCVMNEPTCFDWKQTEFLNLRAARRKATRTTEILHPSPKTHLICFRWNQISR